MYKIPVFNTDNKPLMPTNPALARKLVKARRATPFFKKGIYCIRLNYRTTEYTQPIVVGIDPGSKKEGYTVKSNKYTFLNIQADAITWVKDSIKLRRVMRRQRRSRKTPCRKPRFYRNRNKVFLSPSVKSRWQWKLRILNWLSKLYPITHIIVEDIKATTKKYQSKWNKSFSPLEVGKNWFYSILKSTYKFFTTKQGYETKQLRDILNLKKSKNKLEKSFNAHCVDSWVLANSVLTTTNSDDVNSSNSSNLSSTPDNIKVFYIEPLHYYRRQLHKTVPQKKGIRPTYGGTMSLGLKRGSLVKHKKYGITYVGGTSKGRISLHCLKTKKRLSQSIKVEDCKFLTYNNWLLNLD